MNRRTLFQHQRQALSYLYESKGTAALFMEMRLGKTLTVLRYLEAREKANTLVICPMEGLWAWKREIGLEGMNSVSLVGSVKQRQAILTHNHKAKGEFFLINYEGFRIVEPLLRNGIGNVRTLVLDESRRIANPKAKVTKLLRKFPRNQRRIILSGKPAPESPLEYFEQYSFLYGKFMGCSNYWQFRHFFFQELAPHEWVPRPRSLDRLKAGIQDAGFFLTRKQAGVYTPKIKKVKTLRLPLDLRTMYEKLKREFIAEFKNKEGTFTIVMTKWIPVKYMWMHQIASGFLGQQLIWEGKIKLLLDLLNGDLRGEKVVVWFKYNFIMDVVKEALWKEGFHAGILSGSKSVTDRELTIDYFRDKNKWTMPVLLCQIKCAKTAVDLSVSSTSIYFTNSFSLEERIQSEDRIIHQSKKDPCLYIDLATEDTVDMDVLDLLNIKKGEASFYETKYLFWKAIGDRSGGQGNRVRDL